MRTCDHVFNGLPDTTEEFPMDEATKQVHYRSAKAYGEKASCGKKKVEAYPCIWCDGWHVGRAMTPEEYDQFSDCSE